MNVSINPWYFCNFRCSFCYLTDTQLSDRQKLNVDVLDQRLNEISRHTSIDHIDLYGGEIGLLPWSYYTDVKRVCGKYTSTPINVITNLSMVNDITTDKDTVLSVSYDFGTREQHERVWANMSRIPKQFVVLILANPDLMQQNVDEMIHQLNLLNNIVAVEIKPYSTNQANAINTTFCEYEEFVKKWIESPVNKNFIFTNIDLIEDSVARIRNSFSDDHIYITPTGRFGVLEFDANDREFFLELNSYDEYINWCLQEKNRVLANPICAACEYSGTCLSEHLRDVKDTQNSCNGFIHLIRWYKETQC